MANETMFPGNISKKPQRYISLYSSLISAMDKLTKTIITIKVV